MGKMNRRGQGNIGLKLERTKIDYLMEQVREGGA